MNYKRCEQLPLNHVTYQNSVYILLAVTRRQCFRCLLNICRWKEYRTLEVWHHVSADAVVYSVNYAFIVLL